MEMRASTLFLLYMPSVLMMSVLVNVSARTCSDSPFQDLRSRALQAAVVFEGRVSKIEDLKPLMDENARYYNATFSVRKVYKGSLPKRTGSNKYSKILVGEFGPSDNKCIAPVVQKLRYLIFLEPPQKNSDFHRISGLPQMFANKFGRIVNKTICPGCARPPEIKLNRNFQFVTGKKAMIKCEIRAGMPPPVIDWLKDGQPIQRGSGIIIKHSKKFSRLKIKAVKESHAGTYTCVAANTLGQVDSTAQVSVRPSNYVDTAKPLGPSNFTVQTTASDGNSSITRDVNTPPPKHYVSCGPKWRHYCHHGGDCLYAKDLGEKFCRCARNYTGPRCEYWDLVTFIKELKRREAIDFDRKMTMAGIIVGGVLLIVLFVAAYCMARKRRKEFYDRQRQRSRSRQQQNGQTYTKVSTLDGPVPAVETLPLATRQMSRESRTFGTQTDEYNPLMALRETIIDGPGERPYLDSPVSDEPSMSVTVQHADLTRQRLPAFSATPMVEPDHLSYPNTTTTSAVVEAPPNQEPDSEHSSPSQSSKTESAHGQPDIVNPGDLPPVPNGQADGNTEGGNHSDYDNNLSDEGQDLAFSGDESPRRGRQDGDLSSGISDSDSSDGLEHEHFKELQKKRLLNIKNKQDKGVPEKNHQKALAWETYGNSVPSFPTDPYYNNYADSRGRKPGDRRSPHSNHSAAKPKQAETQRLKKPVHRWDHGPQV